MCSMSAYAGLRACGSQPWGCVVDVFAFPLRCGIIRKGVWWYIDVGLADPIRARSDLS